MRISPLDVRSQEFKKSMRGYDPEEVKAFLDAIADTMEDFLKEKEAAQSELVALRKRVETFTEMEISLRDAMVAAQKAGDEAKMNARRNAELMIREAELEVRQRIADAKRKVDDVFRARETVRAEMRAFLPRLRSLLESQLTYLENIEQEVTSMDLGDGDKAEAREVRSFTQTVEASATEAAAGRNEETGRPQSDVLDEAMHEHHEKQHGEPPPGQDAHGEGAHTGQPHSEQPCQEQPHSEQPHSEQPHQEQPHQEQPRSEQPHQEQPHQEQPHQEQVQEERGPESKQQTTEEMHHASGGVSPWAPDPSKEGPESDEELHISHTPQEESESQEREDVSA